MNTPKDYDHANNHKIVTEFNGNNYFELSQKYKLSMQYIYKILKAYQVASDVLKILGNPEVSPTAYQQMLVAHLILREKALYAPLDGSQSYSAAQAAQQMADLTAQQAKISEIQKLSLSLPPLPVAAAPHSSFRFFLLNIKKHFLKLLASGRKK